MDRSFKKLLSSVGVIPLGTGGGDGQLILGPAFIPVLIDGVVFGGMKASRGADIVAQLRLLKVTGGTDATTRIDPTTELAFFPYSALGGAYAGLYIFTQPGRLIRPVLNLKTRSVEWIGPMEQVFMDIACLAEDKRAETTHMELGPGIMLSQVAAMTPFRYHTTYTGYRMLHMQEIFIDPYFVFVYNFVDLLLDTNLLRCDYTLCPSLSYLTLPHSTPLYHTLGLHCHYYFHRHCYCYCYWFHHFNMTPTIFYRNFSDYNQSPRNMYQCQMGKQVHYTVRFIIDRICIFPFKLILTTFKSNQVYLILSLLSLFGPS